MVGTKNHTEMERNNFAQPMLALCNSESLHEGNDVEIRNNPHLDGYQPNKSTAKEVNQDEDDASGKTFSSLDTSAKKGEPLFPGDCIWYYNPLFVFGNAQGFRETVLLSIDPDNDGVSLVLANGETIPDYTKIRRVYQCHIHMRKVNG